MEIVLPVETNQLFRDFESAWQDDEVPDRFSSCYPNFALSVMQGTSDQGDISFDFLIEKWNELGISGNVDKSSQ